MIIGNFKWCLDRGRDAFIDEILDAIETVSEEEKISELLKDERS